MIRGYPEAHPAGAVRRDFYLGRTARRLQGRQRRKRTFYWIALTHSDDASHAAAVAFDPARDRLPIITTEEILIELLTFFGAQGTFLRTKALAVTKRILRTGNVRVLAQTHETFSAGLDLYAMRLDKAYSMTDCISMETMGRELALERRDCSLFASVADAG
jgi:uncharacterized protein